MRSPVVSGKWGDIRMQQIVAIKLLAVKTINRNLKNKTQCKRAWTMKVSLKISRVENQPFFASFITPFYSKMESLKKISKALSYIILRMRVSCKLYTTQPFPRLRNFKIPIKYFGDLPPLLSQYLLSLLSFESLLHDDCGQVFPPVNLVITLWLVNKIINPAISPESLSWSSHKLVVRREDKS